MKIKIEKSVAVGSVKAPPSKSYAHRLLICSALADGKSTVYGISESDDMRATLGCINSFGINIFHFLISKSIELLNSVPHKSDA